MGQLVDVLKQEYRVAEDTLRLDIERRVQQLEESGLSERVKADRR